MTSHKANDGAPIMVVAGGTTVVCLLVTGLLLGVLLAPRAQTTDDDWPVPTTTVLGADVVMPGTTVADDEARVTLLHRPLNPPLLLADVIALPLDAEIVALRRSDLSVAWRVPCAGGRWLDPSQHDAHLFAVECGQALELLDVHDGTSHTPWGRIKTGTVMPIATEEALVARTPTAIERRDPSSLELVWAVPSATIDRHRPLAVTHDAVLVADEHDLVLHRLEDGAELWRHAANVTEIVAGDGLAYVRFQDGAIGAIDLDSGSERWRHTADGAVIPIGPDLHLAGDGSLVLHQDPRVTVLEPADGAVRWSAELEGQHLTVGSAKLAVGVKTYAVVDLATGAPTRVLGARSPISWDGTDAAWLELEPTGTDDRIQLVLGRP